MNRLLPVLLLLGLLPAAHSAEPPAGPPAVTSASGLFIVTGFQSPDSVQLALWGEEVADRLARHLNLSLPVFPGQPLNIAGRADPKLMGGRVVRIQGQNDGLLTQKLVLVNPEQVNHEEVLEGLCWLLLNRYLLAQSHVEASARVPDWLAVGTAQHIYPDLRARNRRLLLRNRQTDGPVSLDTVLEAIYLPEGRWEQKFLCGPVVSWLLDTEDPATRMRHVFGRLATGQPITSAWLEQDMLPGQGAGSVEQNWQQWVEAQADILYDEGQLSGAHLDALKRLLVVAPGDTTFEGRQAVNHPLVLGDLLAWRKAPWLPGLLVARRTALHRLLIGRPADFQEVVGYFDAYLAGLTTAPEADSVRRLQQGQQALARLEQALEVRRHYLDEVAARLRFGGPQTPVDASAYLDRVEQTLRSGP